MIVLNYTVPNLVSAQHIGIIDLTAEPELRKDFIEKCRWWNRDAAIDTVDKQAQQRFDIIFILHYRCLYEWRRLPRLVAALFKGAKQARSVVLYDCDISTNRVIHLERRQVKWFTCRLAVFNLLLLGLRLAKKMFPFFRGKK